LARFSTPVQNKPGPHQAFYKIGIGYSWRGGVNHPSPSCVEVKERVELHFYSPSGLSLQGKLYLSSAFRDFLLVKYSRKELKMGQTNCPDISVNNYQHTLCNISEERKPQNRPPSEYKRFTATPTCSVTNTCFDNIRTSAMLKTEPSWTDIQSEKSYKMCEGFAVSRSFKGVEGLVNET
jgi:hypothetical protein